MSPVYEKSFVASLVGVAVIIAVVGGYIASIERDGHWINRAGALIVCVEGLLVLVEFSRRMRLESVETLSEGNPYIRLEARRAERQLVIIGVAVAIFGELLHGFGDFLFLVL